MSTTLQLTVQFSLGRKLKDKIHTRGVVEVTVESQNIGMPTVGRHSVSKRHVKNTQKSKHDRKTMQVEWQEIEK